MQICKIIFTRKWHVSLKEIDDFFKNNTLFDIWQLFQLTFNHPLIQICNVSQDFPNELSEVFKQVINPHVSISLTKLEQECTYLCKIIEDVANWSLSQEFINHDGITYLCESKILLSKEIDNDLENGELSIPNTAWANFTRTVESQKTVYTK